MSFPQFMSLTPELQEQVADHCQAHELLALARTCSSLHVVALRALYFDVDISVHNLPGSFPSTRNTVDILAENPHAELGYKTQECLKRQDMFVESLKSHPSYGQWVVRLTWTYIVRWDEDTGESVSDEPLWEALKLLSMVRYLDVASIACQRELVPPPPLFPRAKHIRLVGQMSFAFVRAILLSSDPTNFVSLDLDNLQDFGQFHGGDFVTGAYLSSIPELEDDQGNPTVRHPGTMRGHLLRLQGRCTNLRRLILRSVGNDEADDERWSPKLDEERYNEWATFLNSVSLTLEYLTIEQGLEPNPTNVVHCRPQECQYGRPMDIRFLEHFLPSLSTNFWPRLRQASVYGIGSLPRSHLRNYATIEPDLVRRVSEDLSTRLGPLVLLDVQQSATKTFFYRDDGVMYHT
ncbi:hypothetical protein IFR04_011276 [Cadophora malorum]|uniref:F-box domain-containing protein n=1 Tax=Cadophora malorum TaxID=108018 RepID=A0A8H7TAL3_9HELO|nr:hypothetical protein IFR04_011276 [Cadophora malorum]